MWPKRFISIVRCFLRRQASPAGQPQDVLEIHDNWPVQLPEAHGPLIGRATQMRLLDRLPHEGGIFVLEGEAGIGTTHLMLHWANKHTADFPDGCYYADLNGTVAQNQNEAIVTGILQALGVSPTAADRPEQLLDLFRSVAAGKRILLLLDNAVSPAQVASLLPDGNFAVLVTSRRSLADLGKTHGAQRIPLGKLTTGESLALLREAGDPARVDADPAATAAVIGVCQRLPLALSLAAEQLLASPGLTMGELAADLSAREVGATLVVSLNTDLTFPVVLESAYGKLPARVKRTLWLIAAQPCRALDKFALAALTGLDAPAFEADLALLTRYKLVEHRRDGRIQLQSMIREFAAGHADPEEVRLAERRLIHFLVLTAQNAGNAMAKGWTGPMKYPAVPGVTPLVFAEQQQALKWFRAERRTALTLLGAVGPREPQASRLAVLYLPYLFLTKPWSMCLELIGHGVRIARDAQDHFDLARCLHGMAWVLHELRRDAEALPYLRRAMALQDNELDDKQGKAWTAFTFGECLTATGKPSEALRYFEIARAHFDETHQPLGSAFVLSSMAFAVYEHDPEGAISRAEEAVTIATELDNPALRGCSHHQLGLLHQRDGNLEEAVVEFRKALVIRRPTPERWGTADTLLSLGETYAQLHREADARAALTESMAIFADLHDPREYVAKATLTQLQVPPVPPEQNWLPDSEQPHP